MSGILGLRITGKSTGVKLPTNIIRSSTKIFPTDAAAGMRLHSDGTIDASFNQATALLYDNDLGAWLLIGVASDYEAQMTTGTPNAFSGQVQGSYLNLGTTRDWFALVTGQGVQDCNGTLTIRDVATQTVQASSTVSMYAESSP